MSMYANYLEVVHGGQAGPLVKIRPVKSTDVDVAKSGRVVVVDSNGDFALPTTMPTDAMPLFLLRGTEVPSVYSTGLVSGVNEWVPVGVDAKSAIALVASGGYELQSTEFVDTQTDYVPNKSLTVVADATDNRGKLTTVASAAAGTNWVVGKCSVHEVKQNYMADWVTGQPARGTNAQGRTVVTFWSVFLPKQW